MISKLLKLSSIVLLSSSYLISQEIPNQYYSLNSIQLLYDFEKNWNSKTLLGAYRFQDAYRNQFLNNNSNFLFLKLRLGLERNNGILTPIFLNTLTFKKNCYAYLYTIEGQSGNKKNDFNKRNMISGIGYQNNWVGLQIGRGNQHWGAGEDIKLALTRSSAPYDYLMLSSDYGKIRVKYIHGILEKTGSNVNRYIVAKGIEWTNKESLIIGFSEVVVYSGLNRTIDFSYLNPIASHLELELNNRLKTGNSSASANAVWQFFYDFKFLKRLRLSGNFLIDEWEFDKEEFNKGGGHRVAYSSQLAYSFFKEKILSFYLSQIYIGPFTFRHANGFNNFVNNGIPIGSRYGSDISKYVFGIKYFEYGNLYADFELIFTESGNGSILNDPYGLVDENIIGNSKVNKVLNHQIKYWMGNNCHINFKINIDQVDSKKSQLYSNVRISFFFDSIINLEN